MIRSNGSRYRRQVVLFGACAVVLTALVVAPVPAFAQASKSVDSLNAIIKEVTKIRDQVTGAVNSLKAVGAADSSNLSKTFKDYTKNVEGLQKSQEAANKRGESFKQNREAYFAAWDKKMAGITSPEIKAHMEERKAAVRTTFDSAQPAVQVVRDTFPTFLTELKDIQQMLSVDLSKSGVTSAAPIAQKAADNGATINKNLDTLIGALQNIAAEVSPPK